MKAAGGTGLAIETDVADDRAVESSSDQVERELGEIDVWVNNAFVGALAFFGTPPPRNIAG